MAAAIEQALGATVSVTPGDRGEFTVWVGDKQVAGKSMQCGFPDEAETIEAVRAAL